MAVGHFGYNWDNFFTDAYNSINGGFNDLAKLVTSPNATMEYGSYSDFTKWANENTDGWYSTVTGSVPIVRDFHDAMLQRDKTKDYMANNNLTWSDVLGYNVDKIQNNGSVNSLVNQGTRWLKNASSDLGKLYSEQV